MKNTLIIKCPPSQSGEPTTEEVICAHIKKKYETRVEIIDNRVPWVKYREYNVPTETNNTFFKTDIGEGVLIFGIIFFFMIAGFIGYLIIRFLLYRLSRTISKGIEKGKIDART